MIGATAPLGNDQKASSREGENTVSASMLATSEPVLEESPPIVRHLTLESQKEVTIRQVAPLVIVLTGATFLNASVSPPKI
jgi:hypothetical protein